MKSWWEIRLLITQMEGKNLPGCQTFLVWEEKFACLGRRVSPPSPGD